MIRTAPDRPYITRGPEDTARSRWDRSRERLHGAECSAPPPARGIPASRAHPLHPSSVGHGTTGRCHTRAWTANRPSSAAVFGVAAAPMGKLTSSRQSARESSSPFVIVHLGCVPGGGRRRPSTGQRRRASPTTEEWSYQYQCLVRCLALRRILPRPCPTHRSRRRGFVRLPPDHPSKAMHGLSRHSTLIPWAGAVGDRAAPALPRLSGDGVGTRGEALCQTTGIMT